MLYKLRGTSILECIERGSYANFFEKDKII